MVPKGQELVSAVIQDLNADGRTPPIPSDPSTSLQLRDGDIDSLDLIDLVLAVEARLGEVIGRRVPLMESGSLDPETHDFADINALANRADDLLRQGPRSL